MYLKLADKVSPRKVAIALRPDVSEEDIEWDAENVYEWVYVDFPGLGFSLDITRDHGVSSVEDDALDLLSEEEIEDLPTSGPTYIFGFDRTRNIYVSELDEKLIQKISDTLETAILAYPGRIYMGGPDPEPVKRYEPRREGAGSNDDGVDEPGAG